MKYQINKHQKGNIVQRAIKSDFYNSVPMTAIKMLDPTGISSYGDVYNA